MLSKAGLDEVNSRLKKIRTSTAAWIPLMRLLVYNWKL